jgi:hypothetical protein
VIEKDIPIPAIIYRPYKGDFPFAEWARQMRVGDSVWFEDHQDATTFRNCINKLGYGATGREWIKDNIKGQRIWKVIKR